MISGEACTRRERAALTLTKRLRCGEAVAPNRKVCGKYPEFNCLPRRVIPIGYDAFHRRNILFSMR